MPRDGDWGLQPCTPLWEAVFPKIHLSPPGVSRSSSQLSTRGCLCPQAATLRHSTFTPENTTKLCLSYLKGTLESTTTALLLLLPLHLKYQNNPPAFQRTRSRWLHGLTKIYNEKLDIFYHLISIKYEAKKKIWLPLTSQHLKIALVFESVHTNFKGVNGKWLGHKIIEVEEKYIWTQLTF